MGPISFSIQREPGTFACAGTAGEGSGMGQFTYSPNARFDDALASRGMGRPTLHESFQLAIAGATLAFIDRVRGTAQHAGISDVVLVMEHGVDPRYVDELAVLGYKTPTLDDLIRLRDHGVSPRYVGDLAEVGYKNFSVDELVTLRDHGVSAAFVGRLKAHGYTNLPVSDLIRLHEAGI